jgi:hypothetical protein
MIITFTPAGKVKRLVFFLLLFISFQSWSCTYHMEKSYFIDKDGVVDFDPIKKKAITIYPKHYKLKPDYPLRGQLVIPFSGRCKNPKKVITTLIRSIGDKKFTSLKHKGHGNTPHSGLKRADYPIAKLQNRVNKEGLVIEEFNILKLIQLENSNQHVWELTFKVKIDQHKSKTKTFKLPLIH